MTHILCIYWLFVKIGTFTFGGGYAMIPLFQTELVTRHHFLTETEFANMVALAQMTPGPVGLNAATYIGYTEGVKSLGGFAGGITGALAGTLGVMTPSLILVMLIAIFLRNFKDNPCMKAILSGIRPAVLGLIASAVIFFAETSVFTVPLKKWFSGSFGISPQAAVIFLIVLFTEFMFKINIVWTLLLSAALSYILYLIQYAS